MFRLQSVLFVFLCLQFSFVLSDVPQSVLNGRTPNRQEEILILPKEIPSGDSFLLHSSSGIYKHSEIQDTSFAEMSSHLLGLPSMNIETDRSSFPDSDQFRKAKGHAVFSFESLGASSFTEKAKQDLEKKGQMIKVIDSTYPQDSVSRLTTLMTGSLPSDHGIASSEWPGEEEINEAYSANSQPEKTNLPDVLSQSFRGRSFVISLSSNFQLASALCPHSLTLARQPFWNNFCYFWNPSKNFVDALSVQMDNDFLFTKEHLIQSFRSPRQLPGDFQFDFTSSNTLTLTSGERTASFNLDNKNDILFLSELEMLRALELHLSTKTLERLQKDNSPDFFGFSVSSLGVMRNSEEDSKEKFPIAFDLFSSLMFSLIDKMNQTYSGRLVSDVAFLGSDQPASYVKNQVADALESRNLGFGLEHLPFIPKKSNQPSKDFLELLSQVKDTLHGTPFHAVHFPQAERYSLFKRSLPQANNSTNSTITNTDLANFHICLWVPIALVIALIAFVQAMHVMASNDSPKF